MSVPVKIDVSTIIDSIGSDVLLRLSDECVNQLLNSGDNPFFGQTYDAQTRTFGVIFNEDGFREAYLATMKDSIEKLCIDLGQKAEQLFGEQTIAPMVFSKVVSD